MKRSEVIVGRTADSFEVPVEYSKVREFAVAVREQNFSDGDLHALIPPTFLATAMWWEGRETDPLSAAELDSNRMLHVEQEYVFPGPPPRAGETLTAQSHISDVYEKTGRRSGPMTFVTVVTEFRNSAGELVAEGRWTEASISRAATDAGETA